MRSSCILLIIFLTFSESSYAACSVQAIANSYRVPNGSCYQITGPDCMCRAVTNNSPSGQDIFVPAKTAPEWDSFYTNPPAGVTAVACGDDLFGYSNSITINHTLVGSSTSTNFPMLFSGTYAYLATVANGGELQSASGWDIMFTSDAAGNNRLNYELESYTATSGNIQAWVQIPSLSNTADTVIYIWYGKACLSSQANPTAVWDSNYISVWHMTNGSVLSVADSTSNSITGTIHGQAGNNMAAAGFIDGGGIFAPASSQYLMTPSLGTPAQSVTVTAWVKPNAAGGVVFDEDGAGALNGGWHETQIEVETTNIMKSCMWKGSLVCVASAAASITYGNWYYMGMTYNQPTTTLTGYLNGAVTASTVATKQYPNTGVLFYAVGGTDSTNGGDGAYFSGSIDEVRISKIARSADWNHAEFNNQNSPATFYTIGSQVSH